MPRVDGGVRVDLRGIGKSYRGTTAVRSVDLVAEEGDMVALLGASGCGKTTTLRMIAGLDIPTRGEILVDGRVMSRAGWSLPPEERGMGMVFQSYALWPHMTVFENVAFSLRLRRTARDDLARRVAAVLELVDMTNFARRRVTQLSGGQQQRVALARALAAEPSVLLMDEPLSNLDARLRETMRFKIREVQQRLGITGIYVTHSQDEALSLADKVAVMRSGEIVQYAPPAEIYESPANAFVARVVGLANVIEGKHLGALQDRNEVIVPGAAYRLVGRGTGSRFASDAPVDVIIRPENITIAGPGNRGADDVNRVCGAVARVVRTGGVVDYFVEVPGLAEPIRVQSQPPASAGHGDEVELRFGFDDTVITPHENPAERKQENP